MEAALASPFVRAQLFAPSRELVAFDIQYEVAEPSGIVVTWEPALATDFEASERSLMKSIASRRASRGLPQTTALADGYHGILRDEGAALTTGGSKVAVVRNRVELDLCEQFERESGHVVSCSNHLQIVVEHRGQIAMPARLLRNDAVSIATHRQTVLVPRSRWAVMIWMIAYVYEEELEADSTRRKSRTERRLFLDPEADPAYDHRRRVLPPEHLGR
jgi:hypothetical protein